MSRMEGRIKNLETAWHRLNTRIVNGVPADVEKKYEKKLAEYEQSLANFRDFGQETAPGGEPSGAKIGVPLGKFNLEAGKG